MNEPGSVGATARQFTSRRGANASAAPQEVSMRDVLVAGVRAGTAAGLVAVALSVATPLRAATQSVVVDWNAIAMTAIGAAGQNGSLQERSMAITSVAVSDAVNA